MASPAVLDMKEEDQDKMLQLLERQMQLQFGEVLTSTKKAVRDTSDNNGM